MNVTPETLSSAPAPIAATGEGLRWTPDSRGALFAAGSLVVVALYVALDILALRFPFGPIPVAPWNPAAGLAIGIALVGGHRFAPAILIAAVAAELVGHPSERLAFALTGGLAIGAVHVGIGLVMRGQDDGTVLARMRPLRSFLLIACAGTAAGALLHVAFYGATHDIDAALALGSALRQWLGDFTGAISLVPLIAVLFDARRRRPLRQRGIVDVLVMLLLLCALFSVALTIAPINGHKLFYVAFAPLVYLSVRHGFVGAASGVLAAEVALMLALAASGRDTDVAAEHQLLMVVLAVTTLLIGAVAHERRRALAQVAQRGTELRAQQAALADAMRVASASETASALAHEMSQPISAIGTYARAAREMLRRGQGTPEEIASILERIERETNRTSESVRRIRDFFRVGTAGRQPTSIGELAADVGDALHERLASERVTLQIEMPADLPDVLVDRTQIGAVLHNLLGNALDALALVHGPRRVRIAATVSGPREIEIEVENSGPRIADSVLAMLFEPLATTKPTGMGLGLAISRTIVETHGGRLWLASSQPTTSFHFTLPTHGQDD